MKCIGSTSQLYLDALKNINCGKSCGVMAFVQNTLYLLIVAFTFYYPCYFLHLLLMESWLLTRYVHENCYCPYY